MKRWKKILLGIVLFLLAVLVFLMLYKIRYSMEVAESFEVNDSTLGKRVLIATQGSDFKNAVVDGVVDKIQEQPVYIKVVDIAALPAVNEKEWTAIVIIHTWENWKPPVVVSNFVEQSIHQNRLIVLTTSGNGSFKPESVDAITSASLMGEVPRPVDEIVRRLNKLLQ